MTDTDTPTGGAPGDGASPEGTSPEEEALEAERLAFIEALLPWAARAGWTEEACARAALELGHEPSYAAALFPDLTPETLIRWGFRRALVRAELGDKAFQAQGTTEKIKQGVWRLLSSWAESPEALRAALSFTTGRPAFGSRLLWHLADWLWYAAGDRSVDHNFYTKRTLLAWVLGTTSLVWLEDKSPGRTETQAFLQNRIEGVLRAGKFWGQRVQCASSFWRNWAHFWTTGPWSAAPGPGGPGGASRFGRSAPPF